MMKRSIIFFAAIGILSLVSCDKGELGPVLNSSPDSPAITSPEPGSNYTLTEEAAEDTLLTLEWTAPDYGFPSATNYAVEMGVPGNNFADPVTIGNTNRTSYSLLVGGTNNRLLALGFAAGQQAAFEFRVIASVNDSVETLASEPVSLAFTPYEVVVEYPSIYVPGGYQAASGYGSDWSPADAPALASVQSDNKYEGYVYINDPNSKYKFTDERSWDLNWGDDGADGTLDQNGADIVAANAGYYKINVDLNTMTYTTLNTTWGIIGDATAGGWNSDQDMTYDPDTRVWTITTDLAAGEMKFRANDKWDLNYGDDGADGSLERDGANIVIDEAGNYTIELILSEPVYSYTITKN